MKAKVPCFPSSLPASYSHHQDGHEGTSETRVVFDRDRSSYFLLRSGTFGILQARVSAGNWMKVMTTKTSYSTSNFCSTRSYRQHGHGGTSGCQRVVDGERSSYFPHASSAPRALSCKRKRQHLIVSNDCKNTSFPLKLVFYF